MNCSRRDFLASGLALAQTLILPPGFARNRARHSGVRSIARVDWPPAIMPEHAAFIEKGFSCFADQAGVLAIVDLRSRNKIKVVGQAHLPVKKIIDFTTVGRRGYALAIDESPAGQRQYALLTVGLAPASAPHVLSRVALDQISETGGITATNELICAACVTASGTSNIAVFSAGRNTPEYITSFTLEGSASKLDLQHRNLAVLLSGANCRVAYIDLLDARNPKIRKQMLLDGDYRVMARSRNILVVAGQPASSRGLEAKIIALEPAPHLVQSESLEPLSTLFNIAAQKDHFYFLGLNGRQQQMLDFQMSRDLRLTLLEAVTVPDGDACTAGSALSVKGRSVNIASAWHGVDVLAFRDTAWRHDFTYTIPRFPASGVLALGGSVLLAGGDLKLYDITNPERPALKQTTDCGGTIKSMADAGSFVLCLTQNSLTLRRIDNLAAVNASIGQTGHAMAFSHDRQTAYVLAAWEKKTTITPVKTYANKLFAGKAFDLAAGFRQIISWRNNLLLFGMKDIALYRPGRTPELLSALVLDGYAIRDVAIDDDLIAVSAIDSSARGCLLTFSCHNNKLVRTGAADLPQDGAALALSAKRAVIAGQTPAGHDLASVVDLRYPAMPRLIASFPSVEASSAVSIQNSLAIVAGRGLSIFSLG